ncbi:hypothetical protein PanWU01x14_003270 [Parasponia andersonii]|uniref:Transmembrane protein n=1 Tax=Parasponia andersonii TaxID=3476 RepID=A0A2P5E5G2_PARAD|nr:hypothetical protein PanWU01x14_003270 [Parasponia andersonii]
MPSRAFGSVLSSAECGSVLRPLIVAFVLVLVSFVVSLVASVMGGSTILRLFLVDSHLHQD